MARPEAPEQSARACGGIVLDGPLASSFAPLTGEPLGRVAVDRGPLPGPAGQVVWEIDVPVPDAAPQRQRLWADGEHRLLEFDDRPVLAIDPSRATVGHGDWPTAVTAQVFAAVAVPLLAHEAGASVFHGSASVIDGAASLLLGHSGSGKSSLLVALAEAGCAPLTEDACVVAPGESPRLWPGPPWVRLGLDVPGPSGSSECFDALDKRAWALVDQPSVPVPVGRVVLLEAADGGPPRWEQLSTADALPLLAQHVTWLGDQADRLPMAFSAAARLAGAVPVHVLRLPVERGWTRRGVDTLAG